MGPHALECALTFALLLTLAFPDTGFFQKRLVLVTPPPLPLSGVLEDRAPRSLSFHLHLSFDLCLSFHFEFDVDELSFAIHVLFPLTVEPFQNRIYCWYLDWFRSLGGNLVVTESLKLWVLCDLFGQLMDGLWECIIKEHHIKDHLSSCSWSYFLVPNQTQATTRGMRTRRTPTVTPMMITTPLSSSSSSSPMCGSLGLTQGLKIMKHLMPSPP